MSTDNASRRFWLWEVSIRYIDVEKYFGLSVTPIADALLFKGKIEARQPFTAANRLHKRLYAKGGAMHGYSAKAIECKVIKIEKVKF